LTPLLTVPSDTGLFQHATGRFTVVQAGTMTLRVSGLSDLHMADTGAYRFYVYAVNPLPEHVTSIITPGDSISESIDLPGDIDEFSFTASAGAEFNLLFQPQVASGAVLRAEIIGPAGAIASVEGYGPAPDLFHLVSGRFAVPAAGTYRIRVTGAGSTTPLHTGPYRVFLLEWTHPESVPETLTLGTASVARPSISPATSTNSRSPFPTRSELRWRCRSTPPQALVREFGRLCSRPPATVLGTSSSLRLAHQAE
jgi:hypothetical protein